MSETSNNSEFTQNSFISLSSCSSLSSASCYQHQYTPSRDSIDFTDYSQHQQQPQQLQQQSTHTLTSPTVTSPNPPYPYNGSRRDSSRAYNCYKPSQTSPLASITTLSSVNPPSAFGNTGSFRSKKPQQQQQQRKPNILPPPQSQPSQPLAYYPPNGNILGSLSHINNRNALYNSRTYACSSPFGPTSPVADSNERTSAQAHPYISQYNTTTAIQASPSMAGQNQQQALHEGQQQHSSVQNTFESQNSQIPHRSLTPPHQSMEPQYKQSPRNPVEGDQKSVKSSFSSSTMQKVRSKSSWRRGLRGLRKSQSSRMSVDEPSKESAAEAAIAAQRRTDRFALSPQTSTSSSRFSNYTVQSFGLVSRSGDTRLRDSPEAREEYFEAIQVRFLVCCSLKSAQHLQYALSITPSKSALAKWEVEKVNLLSSPSATSLGAIEMSLRQLREAVLTLTSDYSTVDIFVYSVKVSAMEGHHEAYIPSFHHILNTLYPEVGLPEDVFLSVFELYILHLVHFNNDTVKAFDLLGEYYCTGSNRLWETVRVWVERDYVRWRRLFDTETNLASKRIMQMGELTIATEALNRIGASYMTISQSALESIMGMTWERLVTELNCVWRNDNGTIVIKERK